MTTDATLHLGLYQHCGSPDGLDANLTIIERATAEAATRQIDILVFPECFLTGYWRADGPEMLADQIDREVIERLADCARHSNVAFVVGSYRRRDDRVHNSALVFTPQEGLVSCYHKRALYGDWERRVFVPGDQAVMVHYRGFNIGLLICFDVEYPELVRELAARGADLVVVPTALMEPYAHIADYVVPSRAIENQIFVAYSNRIGIEGPFHYVGRSRICGPSGPIAVDATGNNACLIDAILRRSDLERSRADITYIDSIPGQTN